jgi:hypothetical protein
VPHSAAPVCPLTIIAWRLGALTVPDLWWRYVELGGNRPRPALAGYLAGSAAWPAFEHNTLAQALNECLWSLGHPSVAPYRALEDQRGSVVSSRASEIHGESRDTP